MNVASGLDYALSPAALKRDGLRLGLIIVVSLIAALIEVRPFAIGVLVVFDSLALLVASVALTISLRAMLTGRTGGRRAAAIYGSLTVGLAVAIYFLVAS